MIWEIETLFINPYNRLATHLPRGAPLTLEIFFNSLLAQSLPGLSGFLVLGFTAPLALCDFVFFHSFNPGGVF
jgi:hypothetical protein